MTRQSCLHMPIFFSKGVMASVTLSCSMVAMSLRHSRNATFSCCSISWAVCWWVQAGRRGMVKGTYCPRIYYCSWPSPPRKTLTMATEFFRASAWTICESDMTTCVYRSASKVLEESWASQTNSSREFCSSTETSFGLLCVSIVVCYKYHEIQSIMM